MTVHDQVKRLFDYFHNKVYRSHLDLNLSSELNRKMVDNFAKLVGSQLNLPNVGVSFLVDYFAFQFKYWSDKTTQRKLTLNWVIGPKAFQRWWQRNPDGAYYVRRFVQEHGLDLDALRRELAPVPPEEVLNSAEELEKVRFQDEARLYHCTQTTTGYYHRSMTCLGCSMRQPCKRHLFLINPTLYAKRGYV